MKNLIFAIAMIVLASEIAMADVPLKFTIHGVLKKDGELVNSTKNITTTIYDGENVISESSTQVKIIAGHFFTTIDIDPNKIIASNTLSLGVHIDGTELLDKLPITAVPYSISALQAVTANNITCDGCITPSHLSFVPNTDDFEIPSCNDYETLRSDGSKYVCSDALKIDDSRTDGYLTEIKGNIGINAKDGFGHDSINRYVYVQNDNNINDLNPCPCDNDSNKYDCDNSDGFVSYSFSDEACYDQAYFSGENLYRIFHLSNTVGEAIDNLLVVKDGQVGIGTGAPKAPIHIKSNREANQPEVIIESLQPEIKLESIGQEKNNSFTITVSDSGLEFIDNSSGKKVIFDDGYLKVDREITEWEARKNNIKAKGTIPVTCNCDGIGCSGGPSGAGCSYWECYYYYKAKSLSNGTNISSCSDNTCYFSTPITNPLSDRGSVTSTKISFSNYTERINTSSTNNPGCHGGNVSFVVYGED